MEYKDLPTMSYSCNKVQLKTKAPEWIIFSKNDSDIKINPFDIK